MGAAATKRNSPICHTPGGRVACKSKSTQTEIVKVELEASKSSSQQKVFRFELKKGFNFGNSHHFLALKQ